MLTNQTLLHIFKRVFFLLLFYNSATLCAQTDSLAHKSYKELNTSYQKIKNSNPKDAKSYAEALYKLAIRQKDEKKIGTGLYNKGFIAYNLANYDSAYIYSDKSLAIGKTLQNDSLLLQNTCLKGNILVKKGNYTEAIQEYLEAKKIANRMGNIKDILLISHNIGMIKKQTKDHQEAAEIFLENLTLARQYDHQNLETLEILSMFALSDTYLRMKNYNKAEKYTDSTLTKTSSEEYRSIYLPLSINKTIIKFQKKEYDVSIEYARNTLVNVLAANDSKSLNTIYLYLGKNHMNLKKCDSAIKYFELIKENVEKKRIKFPELEEVYQSLALCYTKLGNTQKSLENQELYNALDEVNDSINVNINNELHNDEIKPLKKEIKKLDDYGKQQESRAKLWYGISAALVLSLIAFFFLYKRKQQQAKKRFQELLVTIDALEQTKNESQPVKPTASVITDESVLEILEGLKTFEEKEYFLRQDCTLGFVAKKLKTNTSYLSNVINTYKEKPFKSYLTELRINAALIRLRNDEKLRAYTIKAIAEEFGFKRPETFSRAFKAQTNMYPSYYIKSLDNQRSKK